MSTENPSRPDDTVEGVPERIPSTNPPHGTGEGSSPATVEASSLELPQAAPDFDGEAREEAAATDTVGMIGTFPLGRPAAREQGWTEPGAETSQDGSIRAPGQDPVGETGPDDDPVEPTGDAPVHGAPDPAADAAVTAATSHARRTASQDADDVSSTAVRRRSLFTADGSAGSAPSGSSPSSAEDGPGGQPTATVPTGDGPGPGSGDSAGSTLTVAATRPDQVAQAPEAPDEETPAWRLRDSARPAPAPAGHEEDAVLLAGSSVVGRPASRTGAHWAGVLLAVVVFPFAWFLVHDGASYLTGGDATTWPTALSARGLGELVVGAAAFTVAVLTARRSSLGAFVVGVLCLLIGLPFVVAPVAVGGAIGSLLERLEAHSTLGADLAGYLMTDGLSGRFVLLGLFMVGLGAVSHSARRAGRREQEIVDRVRRA